MRYVSKLFQPIITIPKNAKIKNSEVTCKSQKLLLECGLVRPTASGLFTLLPLVRRALDKLETLVRVHIEKIGGQRLSVPALTSEGLWDKSGRLGGGGPELMKMVDRHDKRYILAPTHEESIADLLADVGPLSYKQLPLLLYQISNKYRDEQRPKHGLLRSRQFSMLDAYGAHNTQQCAAQTYSEVTAAYTDIFAQLQLPVHRVQAPSGEMGGSLSHEWQLLASAGEDAIHICPSCSHSALAADEQERRCEKCDAEMERESSIEVGHTFILGTKYSDPLKAHFTPSSGPSEPIVMSCYGIGLTRLLAASIEVLSSEKCIRWPQAIAPYNTIIIGPKEGSNEWQSIGPQKIDQLATCLGDDILIDDRHNLTIGKRLMMADKMGYPRIVVCGKSALENPPKYEVYFSTANGNHTTKLLREEELIDSLRDSVRVDLANKLSN